MAATTAALQYHEPDILSLLINASFLLSLNLVGSVVDKAIYCGLVGQILIGVAWGTPGGKLLHPDIENAVVELGYLGLILLIYDGGLSTSSAAIRANFVTSLLVAFTGVTIPIALSFLLQPISGATPLQSFAAGSALCSTSLGTTVSILKPSGLDRTQLGTILSTAAVLDDLVGLIMVQVISNVGKSKGFVLVLTILACFVIVPFHARRIAFFQKSFSVIFQYLPRPRLLFLFHSLFLGAIVTAASYAGTSNLLAAYMAGIFVTWCDENLRDLTTDIPSNSIDENGIGGTSGAMVQESVQSRQQAQDETQTFPQQDEIQVTRDETKKLDQKTTNDTGSSGREVYDQYCASVVDRLLKLFFFASIGFAIPISKMFQGRIIWRGIIYAMLMAIGKLLTAIWLLGPYLPRSKKFNSWMIHQKTNRKHSSKNSEPRQQSRSEKSAIISTNDPVKSTPKGHTKQSDNVSGPATKTSLYPASILGAAMVARGEIGFLIASISQSNGIFASEDISSEASSDLYMIAIWAIMLCTIGGPIAVGLLIRRVNRLRSRRETYAKRNDPLLEKV